MKTFFLPHRSARIKNQPAFTLVEMVVSLGIFSMVTLAVVYAFLFGSKIDQLTQSKLGASDQSRRGFDLLATDVRSAKSTEIGNCTVAGDGSLSSFTEIGENTAQQGPALKLYLTTDTNTYVCYYFETSAGKLRRMHSGISGSKIIAQYLTNSTGSNTMYFRNELYNGTLQTVRTHKGVISTTLGFSQYQYPLTRIGTGFYYDRYQLSFKLTPHAPDGN